MKKSTQLSTQFLKMVEKEKRQTAERLGIPVTEIYVIGDYYTGWFCGTYEQFQDYMESRHQ